VYVVQVQWYVLCSIVLYPDKSCLYRISGYGIRDAADGFTIALISGCRYLDTAFTSVSAILTDLAKRANIFISQFPCSVGCSRVLVPIACHVDTGREMSCWPS